MVTKWVLLTQKYRQKPNGVSHGSHSPALLQQISWIYLEEANNCYQQMLTFQQKQGICRCWVCLCVCCVAFYVVCQAFITSA